MRDVINYDRLKQLLQEPIRNISHAYYDAYVEANAVVRAKAGIKTIIVRRQLGKCCDWCKDLVGIYDYFDAPDDIYKRHDNCKCMVTVRNGNGTYTDVWTKKEYLTQKEARKAQTSILNRDAARNDDVMKAKRDARQKGQAYADVTDVWLKYKLPKGSVMDNEEVFYQGKYLHISPPGKKQRVLLNDDDYEREIAQKLISIFGGNIQRVPEIKNIKNAKTPDYLWDGVPWDLKSIVNSKNPNCAVLNLVDDAEGQAHCFIINLTKGSPLSITNVIGQCKNLFNEPAAEFVEDLILLNNGKLERVFSRI